MSVRGRISALVYSIAALLLFVYSYTQVDLSLTLSQVSIWQTIQKQLQYIGYFNRPLSTVIFLLILAVLFILYGVVVRFIRTKELNRRDLWVIIAAITIVTVLSYPAFSYDFFNYLFTSKTVLIYHKNPYTVIPLQFSGVEPWLSFMHWTHLPTAYTPVWIIYTLIPFIFGFGYFLFRMWNLKLFIAAAYLFTAWGIGKILEKEDKQNATLGVAIFALNPLIITECLVSPHNDIVMMALAIGSMLIYQRGKHLASWFVLSLSVAMKLMTIFLIPAFFMKWRRPFALVCMMIGFVAVLTQRDVLSWYWVWVVPFVALVPDIRQLTVISTGVSLGLLLRYAPFLYFGNWNDPVPRLMAWGTWIPVAAALFIVLTPIAGKKLFPRT